MLRTGSGDWSRVLQVTPERLIASIYRGSDANEVSSVA